MLHVVLGLEDFGEVPSQVTAGLGTTQSLISASATENTATERSDRPAQPQAPPVQAGPRELPEYRAAIELEMWKEQQEEAFQNKLKEQESQHMHVLAEEWKKRDKEREMIVKRKVDEYNKLEEKLRQSISDLERREKQISTSEAELHRLRTDLLREHEQKLTELREASRRLKEDCDHRIELERLRQQELEEQNKRLKDQLRLTEKRQHDKENELLSIKEQQFNRPEVKLQAEMNLLLLEKAELERKLDSVTKSKIHYKQQWGRALRELARIKQTEQVAAKERLKKQERELEHMRLRYLAAEEKENNVNYASTPDIREAKKFSNQVTEVSKQTSEFSENYCSEKVKVTKSEKQELERVKEDLMRLREQGQGNPSPVTQRESQEDRTSTQKQSSPVPSGNNEIANFNDNRVAKLIEERDTLLQTGVYSTDDKIISELDRQIREAIANKG